MYENQASSTSKAPLRSELISNALDQNNQNLSQAIDRLESALTRLGYGNFAKDAKAEVPKPVPMGAFGAFEEKIQRNSAMLDRLNDLCGIFEGFV